MSRCGWGGLLHGQKDKKIEPLPEGGMRDDT